MTKRDFEMVASVLAEIETRLESGTSSMLTPWDVLNQTAETFRIEFGKSHPRFNAARFDIAAMPIKHAKLKAAILAKLES
jgi:hypothetical protein